MSYQTISLQIADGVATLTLDRPDKLNALTPEMLAEILAVLDNISASGSAARCLLITGAGRAFCSGADLANSVAFSASTAGGSDTGPGPGAEVGRMLREVYHPLFEKLRALEMPVVAAVNGVAAGAGMSLAIAADIVIAARSAYFLQAFIHIGLLPDSGSTYMLPRLLGKARATAAMMLGEKLPAETAAEWGLIYEVVDDEALMEVAVTLAKRLAKGPTLALAAVRQAVSQSESNDFTAQLEAEAVLQSRLANSGDCLEGIGAFLAKRPAEFKGE
jgi:2-(1,2-epoxy-1,2-dihydrophenyl)acetyl-CoA isomerase